jgi:23S rRNA (guanine745-N1)-methyltransferase
LAGTIDGGVTPHLLSCTVRNCGRPLSRAAGTLACPAGHSFDIARTGYVNLLQAQDRRSRTPGDTAASVDARAGLLADGVGRTIIDRVVARATSLDLPPGAPVVDLGAGSGEVLGSLARLCSIEAIGLDISTAAVTRAARDFPDLTWVIANADRRLPFVDGSVRLVLSLHARRNPAECARVLMPGGHLLVGVPSADDLRELRETMHGTATVRDRAETVVSEHAPLLVLVARETVLERHRLDREAVHDLLRSTYRGARTGSRGQVEALGAMEVTLATDLLLFTPPHARSS